MKKKKEAEGENKEVYVKIDPLESMDLKRALLEITASGINMQIAAERFKEKRKQVQSLFPAALKTKVKALSEWMALFVQMLEQGSEKMYK